jgi:hypothetical protein
MSERENVVDIANARNDKSVEAQALTGGVRRAG